LIDPAIITTGLSAISGSIDILKKLREMAKSSGPEMQEQIADLLDQLITVKINQSELLDKFRDMGAELERLKSFEEEKTRYQLTEVSDGVVVYQIKEDARKGEPDHWLCANCFEEKVKAFLLKSHNGTGSSTYMCNKCKTNIIVRYDDPAPKRAAGVRNRRFV